MSAQVGWLEAVKVLEALYCDIALYCHRFLRNSLPPAFTKRVLDVSFGTNPDFTANTLPYQLEATKASVLIVHPKTLLIAFDAARTAGLSFDRIIVFDVKCAITADMACLVVERHVE